MSILGDRDSTMAAASSTQRSVLFISHEKSDHAIAGEIRRHLEAGGFDCWMAPDDIAGPTSWPEQINNAIDRCAVMLVVVSSNASDSAHVSREVDIAIENGKPLLPVRVEDIVPSGSLNYLLRLAQWIDLFPGPIADHAATLQAVVGSMLTEPAAPARPVSAPPRSKWLIAARRWRAGNAGRLVWVVAVGLAIAVAFALGIALGGGDDQTATNVVTATQDEESDDVASETSQPTAEETTNSAAPAGKSTITRVSVASDGTQGNDHSLNPDISGDGRYVVFDSVASNLVDGDTNDNRDVFVHDRDTGETTRISQLDFGGRIEEADGASSQPRISGDGRYVVFASSAGNLVPGYEIFETGFNLIYLHDRETGTTSLISLPGADRPHLHPAISDDGTIIAYATYVENQLPLDTRTTQGTYEAWVHDLTAGTTTLLAEFDTGQQHVHISPPSVAADGSLVVVSGNDGGTFIFERATSDVSMLGQLHGGGVGSFLALPEGSRIAFSADASYVADDLSDATDVYEYDWKANVYTLLLEAARPLSISGDGRFLAIAGQFDRGGEPFVLDTRDGTAFGFGGPVGLDAAELSGDGRWIVFSTSAPLVADDSNNKQDVHLFRIDAFGE